MADSDTATANHNELPKSSPKESFDEVPLDKAISTYISYAILIFWGYISDLLRRIGVKNDGLGRSTCKDVSCCQLT